MTSNLDERFIYTTRYVLDNDAPVTTVVHDLNDEWFFWSEEGEVAAEARVVLFREIIATDKSLEEIVSLPIGNRAYRKDIQDKWTVAKIEMESNE